MDPSPSPSPLTLSCDPVPLILTSDYRPARPSGNGILLACRRHAERWGRTRAAPNHGGNDDEAGMARFQAAGS